MFHNNSHSPSSSGLPLASINNQLTNDQHSPAFRRPSNRRRLTDTEVHLLNDSLSKAVKALQVGEYSSASAFFLIVFRLAPHLFVKWRGSFLLALDQHIQTLERRLGSNNAEETVMKVFDEVVESLPDCEDVKYNLGCYFFRRGQLHRAAGQFLETLAINPDYHAAHLSLENLKASAIERWHFIMINDTRRNQCFREAIQKAVRNGHRHVLDIGAGSGLLSLFAVDAGANQVTACEVNEMLYHMCCDVLKTNRADDKIRLINRLSTDLEFEEKVDLVVTEVFDAALFGERCLSTLRSAWKTLLQPKGLVIPNKSSVFGVLFQSQQLRKTLVVDDEVSQRLGISEDFIPCLDRGDCKYSTADLARITDIEYLTEPFKIIDVNFNNLVQLEQLMSPDYDLKKSVEFCKSGIVDALGVWFQLDLMDDVQMSTIPSRDLIGWEQAVYSVNEFGLQSIEERQTIDLVFTFNEDFMKLKNICGPVADHNKKQFLNLKNETIKQLNAHLLNSVYEQKLNEYLNSLHTSINILDVSSLPIISLSLLKHPKINRITVIDDDESKEDVDKLILAISCKQNETQKISRSKFEDVYKQTSTRFDVIISDFVEPSGLMRSNLLEQLTYLKLTGFNNNFFIPMKIKIIGVFVESEDVLRRSRLVGDDRVGGYQIKDLLNVFETETLQNLQMSHLDVIRLSAEFELMTIDLVNNITRPDQIDVEPSEEVIVDVTAGGKIQAVIYWYQIVFDKNLFVSTDKLGLVWNQAAFVFKKELEVKTSEQIKVKTVFTNGFLRIKLHDS